MLCCDICSTHIHISWGCEILLQRVFNALRGVGTGIHGLSLGVSAGEPLIHATCQGECAS